ncbi:Panacea domain-containing protein [Paenibacillus humicus]|uniref:Panacea domain-containing protein n=1 Tax=Paenibacillus humicus TaxID=412861 RepID=UPI003D26925E
MAKIYQFKKVSNMSIPITTVYDVAKAFLNMESMTPKKLQKLCYYAYGWYLALEKKPLFENNFEAWIHGPVDPGLYTEYKEYGWNEIEQEKKLPVDISNNPDVMEFLEEVYASYGHLDGNQLEYLTHRELPWKEARKGLKSYEASKNPISDDTIMEFFTKELP